MYRLTLPILLLLAGCATGAGDSGEGARQPKQIAKVAEALRGLTPGKPQNCIDQSRVQQIKTFENTILYEYSRREIYRNDTSAGCFGLRTGDIVVTRTPSGQLCQGEIIRTVDGGTRTPSGACGLGQFVPYRK